MTTPPDFSFQYAQLMEEMNARMNEPDNDRLIIEDGVMYPEKYFANRIRLAWLMKEPYDGPNGTGGGWVYHDMFKQPDLYGRFKGGHRTTWHPIIYISNSIQNGFPLWHDIPYIRDKHELCDVVRETAFINIQKLPAKGVTRTNGGDLWEAMKKHSDLLLRQIDLLNPNVLIFANTLNVYRSLPEFKDIELHNHGSANFFEKDGKLYIDAYHPAQTTISGKTYFDDVTSIVKKWYEKNLK